MYVLADQPDAIINVGLTVDHEGRVSVDRYPTGDARSDEIPVAVVLRGDLRLRLSQEQRDAAPEQGVFVSEVGSDDVECPRERNENYVRAGLCERRLQVLTIPRPASDTIGVEHGIEATPVGRWAETAGGTTVIRTPTALLGGRADMDSEPWPPSNERWFPPSRRSGISTFASGRREDELEYSAPDVNRDDPFASGTGTGWKVDVTNHAKRVSLVDGYARYVNAPAAARAQRDIILGGILLGLGAAILVEVGLLGLRAARRRRQP